MIQTFLSVGFSTHFFNTLFRVYPNFQSEHSTQDINLPCQVVCQRE